MSGATTGKRIIFRDLPGIAEIERQYLELLDNRLMADEIADLKRAMDDKSLQLFGITEEDTDFWQLPMSIAGGSPEQWERHFEFIEEGFEEENEFWDFFNIDVTDGEGMQLGCMYAFGRQLVCALKRLHPAAVLTFVEGERTDDQMQAAAEAWGRHLLRGGEAR